MTKVLVIGAGFAGLCAAHLLSEKGWKVTLVERSPFLSGGSKTFSYGGHPYTYGPRHFLGTDESLFEFLNKYVPMRRIHPEFLTYIESDQQFFNFPIHRDDINLMADKDKIFEELDNRSGVENAQNLEEYWLSSVGPTLYSKYVEAYSKKMWQIDSNTELDDFSWSPKGVALSTGPRGGFPDSISAFPYAMNGYDDYADAATKDVEVHINTEVEEYDVENHKVKIEGQWHTYDIIVSTISPEYLLNNAFGPLRWIGRDLIKLVLPVKELFPPNVYFLYYANQEPFTRVVEYKKFYQYDSPTTLISLEVPSFNNKLYPYPVGKDQAIAKKYLDALPENVFSLGRAGSYEYRIDIDDCIRQGHELAAQL